MLAVQAARLVWALVTPLGPFGDAPPAQGPAGPAVDLSILASFDPFFRVAGGASGPEGTGDAGRFVLYGVRADAGGKGSAILAEGGGPQRSVTVGEEISPGVTLAAVGADHVVLASGAVRQRVGFPVPQADAAAAPSPPSLAREPAQGADGGVVDPRRLMGQITLVPRMREGQPAGYTVFPRGGSELLAQAGLRQGDVLLAVDGVTLTPERLSELPETLAAATSAEIRFERGGQTLTTRIRMSK